MSYYIRFLCLILQDRVQIQRLNMIHLWTLNSLFCLTLKPTLYLEYFIVLHVSWSGLSCTHLNMVIIFQPPCMKPKPMLKDISASSGSEAGNGAVAGPGTFSQVYMTLLFGACKITPLPLHDGAPTSPLYPPHRPHTRPPNAPGKNRDVSLSRTCTSVRRYICRLVVVASVVSFLLRVCSLIPITP